MVRRLHIPGACAALLALAVPAAATAQDGARDRHDGDQAGDNLARDVMARDAMTRDGPIVVTGTTNPLALDQLGYSLTIIDRAAIERSHIAWLSDLLREVPGVAVNRSGSFGAPTQVRIRGAEGNHTLVLIDGVEVAPIGEGEFDFSNLLADSIERVEVLRGPQSGLYGSNALAGVVNVITRGADSPPLSASLEGGSFGTFAAGAGARLGTARDFLALSGTFRSTDGISTAAIGSEADGDRNVTLHLRGGSAPLEGLHLDGSLFFVDRATEADGFDFSGGPDQGLAVDDASFADTRLFSGNFSLTADPAPGWSARAGLAYTEQSLTGGADRITGRDFGNEGQRLRLSAQVTHSFDTGPAAAHALTMFADYEHETYRNTVPTSPDQIARERRTIGGFGAQYRLGLFDQLYLAASLRHDANSRFADTNTWSLAGSWIAGRWIAGGSTRLHASWGRGVTNPTFYEQFGFDPGSFVGNPDLKPESARGYDFGVEQRIGDGLRADLTWFSSTLTDEIVSAFPSVENGRGKSRRKGVEAALDADLGPVRLAATYTWLNARDPDGSREVRRPEHQASLDASGTFGPQGRGSLDLGLAYNGRMLDDDFRDFFTNGFASVKSPLDAYLLVRAAASWRVGRALTVFGRVENLLDKRYQEVLSYGTPGLSVYGGLRIALD